MNGRRKTVRCAVYTRKSSEHNLDLEFNSLHAQREACEAYIKSQVHEGWQLVPDSYDDGAFSGASLDRPDLQRLLADIAAGRIDNVVVYKVDRLTRSLTDFAKLVELFDQHGVSFVSVTQAFNTTTSMGRLTLNVLLSFAQFEREVIGERVRDKIAASKRKGLFMGGNIPLGYVNRVKKLVVVPEEAEQVRRMFHMSPRPSCSPAKAKPGRCSECWIDELMEGATLAEIAKQEGCTARHVRAMTRLAFVSPDLVNSIMHENAATGLTATRLAQELPLEWSEQAGRYTGCSPTIVSPSKGFPICGPLNKSQLPYRLKI